MSGMEGHLRKGGTASSSSSSGGGGGSGLKAQGALKQ